MNTNLENKTVVNKPKCLNSTTTTTKATGNSTSGSASASTTQTGTEKKFRLSRAGRKRCEYLMKRGYSKEEARLIAREPMDKSKHRPRCKPIKLPITRHNPKPVLSPEAEAKRKRSQAKRKAFAQRRGRQLRKEHMARMAKDAATDWMENKPKCVWVNPNTWTANNTSRSWVNPSVSDSNIVRKTLLPTPDTNETNRIAPPTNSNVTNYPITPPATAISNATNNRIPAATTTAKSNVTNESKAAVATAATSNTNVTNNSIPKAIPAITKSNVTNGSIATPTTTPISNNPIAATASASATTASASATTATATASATSTATASATATATATSTSNNSKPIVRVKNGRIEKPRTEAPKNVKRGRNYYRRLRKRAERRQRRAAIVKLAILPSDFPRSALNTDQILFLKEAIMDMAIAYSNDHFEPRINRFKDKAGYLLLNCADDETANWLMSISNELKPWENASFRMVEEKFVPKSKTVVGFFPNSIQMVNERILALIQEENVDICVDSWRVLQRQEYGQHVKLIIAFDYQSADNIEALGFRLNYCSGKVLLRYEYSKRNLNTMVL